MALYANSIDIRLTTAGIQLQQYVASCSIGGIPCNITRDFELRFHPYFLNCYRYHKPHSGDDSPWLMPGMDNGLSIIVLTGSGMVDQNKREVYGGDLLPGIYDAGGVTAGDDGVRVMIHPDGVEPIPLAEGFDVPPGFSASLSVRARRNERIGPPHGDCIDHDPISPWGDETKYRQMDCQQHCLQRHIRDKCRCYEESLPIDNDERKRLGLQSCRTIHFPEQCSQHPDDIAPCVDALMTWYEGIKCAKRVREQVRENRDQMTSCQCRAACDEFYYDVSYSLARWPAPGFEGDAVYNDIFHLNRFMDRFGDSETARRHFNESGDRAKALRDFARINVYVADPEVRLDHSRVCARELLIVAGDQHTYIHTCSLFQTKVHR